MIENDLLQTKKQERYQQRQQPFGQTLLDGQLSLDDISAKVLAENIEPQPISGHQELFENIVNRYL